MLYRGIEYDIRVGITRGTLIWIAHTPRPRRGESRSQATAKLAAEKAIDAWCRNNPVDCGASVAKTISTSA